ncbi:MAG TPA: hypothetical protein PLS20_03975 [Ruminococcus flavefaciens]|nr:hypothetical protein [Ruminococcus flavefaciens]
MCFASFITAVFCVFAYRDLGEDPVFAVIGVFFSSEKRTAGGIAAYSEPVSVIIVITVGIVRYYI